jgi:putative permease
MDIIKNWFRRHFSNPQVTILAVILVVGFCIVFYLGHILTPVLAALVIAYLLESQVARLQRMKMPRLAAVSVMFLVFFTCLLVLLFGLLPSLSRQVVQLVQQLPSMINRGAQQMLVLPEQYPDVVSRDQITEVMSVLKIEATRLGTAVVSFSVASVPRLFMLAVYLVLVPLLVFFFLKDKDRIKDWVLAFLPRERELAARVWKDVDAQIGNYVRGKFWEIIIVWTSAYVVFSLLGLQYAMLLSFLTGVSVLVPIVGALAAFLPVAVVAYFQYGSSSEFLWACGAYGIIQVIDGNLLAPLLLSGVTHLHPVAVIVSVLLFGGLWGFWGVFFAIPLATVVHAVIKAWPRQHDDDFSTSHEPEGASP